MAAVGPDDQVPDPADSVRCVFPEHVVLPGFINAHTHLELHGLRGAVPEPDFVRWLGRIRELKDETEPAAWEEAARTGVREAWRYGTTTVADTGTSGATVRALAALGGRGIYYQEVIAPHPEGCDAALAALAETLERLEATAPPSVRIGVAPHAPYTVSPELMGRAIRYARQRALPVACHLAESRAETALLTAARGPFAEMWRRRGIPLPAPQRSPIAYAERLGLLGPDLLAIHVVQADADDVALLAGRGVAVVLCFRSNARHGHGAPPLSALRAAGVRLALGTDSVASVDSLDLLAEARLARRDAGLSAEAALGLLTVDAASALAMEGSVGSLDVGKWGDLCAIRIGARESPAAEELAEAVLAAGADDIVATFVGGKPVYRAERGAGGAGAAHYYSGR